MSNSVSSLGGTPSGASTNTLAADILRAAREIGDERVDPLAAELLRSHLEEHEHFGRPGFNLLLVLATQLEAAPELMLLEDSHLKRLLSKLPARFVDYFDPIPIVDPQTPESGGEADLKRSSDPGRLPSSRELIRLKVDPNKLVRASELWQENSLVILMMLYLASLPTTYLAWRGIPALYDHLGNKDQFPTRIYETGLFLASVLDPDGLKIVEDVPCDHLDQLRQCLQSLDPGGQWQRQGRRVVRSAGACQDDKLAEQLKTDLAATRKSRTSRYIWGKGFIAARKVRFLHASMRFMLLHPDELPGHGRAGRRQWIQQVFGLPVNQTHMAFALLSFSYVVLRGMECWGRTLERAEKSDFLHLWELVGHLMGVQSELIPRTWDEAKKLYHQILREEVANRKQADKDAVKTGEELTSVLFAVLEELLPHFFGLEKKLPAVAVRDLLGETHEDGELARFIFDKEHWRVSQEVLPQVVYGAAKVALHHFYRVARFAKHHVVELWKPVEHGLHRLTEELIASMRGAYQREPFFVPEDATAQAWVPIYAASGKSHPDLQDFNEQLISWRQKLYKWLFLAVIPLVAGVLSLALALLLFFLLLLLEVTGMIPFAWLNLSAPFFGLGAIGMAWGSSVLNHRIPAIYTERPRLADWAPVLPWPAGGTGPA